ncbi:MFS transporter [Amycolatopsis sp. NBC_00345]|uniref:MFS transporter n=1 Tax=Amycolatopsis sp. NBC_00345 TaxID=2975955 RepID=UPI002E26FA15
MAGTDAGSGPRNTSRGSAVILVVVLAAVLMVSMDNSILNVALKTLAEPPPAGLGADQSRIQWTIDAYTLAYAGLLLTSGLIGDRIGHKKLLLAGAILFGGASAVSAYARTPMELIALRAVMGAAGALIMPATLAIISAEYPGDKRTRALGIWTAVVGVAVVLGPIIGGALLGWFWWGSVFLINVPIVLAVVVAVCWFVPDAARAGGTPVRRMDPVGMGLSVLGLLGLIYGIIRVGEYGDWTRPDAIVPFGGGLVLLGGFVLWERSVDHPALNLHHFRERGFAAAATALGVLYFALTGGTLVIAFYLQGVRGYSALLTGVCVLPLAVSLIIFAPRVSKLVRRFGVRAVCVAGLTAMGVGLLGLATTGTDTPIWLFELYLFVFGTGTAHVHPPATGVLVSALPSAESGAASAVNNTFRQVGASIGAAILGSVLNAAYQARIGSALDGLPPPLAEPARGSLTATLRAAADLAEQGRGSQAQSLARAATEDFVDAMRITWVTAAAVVLATAVVVAVVMPQAIRAKSRSRPEMNTDQH